MRLPKKKKKIRELTTTQRSRRSRDPIEKHHAVAHSSVTKNNIPFLKCASLASVQPLIAKPILSYAAYTKWHLIKFNHKPRSFPSFHPFTNNSNIIHPHLIRNIIPQIFALMLFLTPLSLHNYKITAREEFLILFF